MTGWSGDNLIYTLSRTDLNPWQTGSGKLKAYNVSTGKLTMLDQTTGSGNVNSNVYEYYNFVYLSAGNVIYGKGWTTQSQDDADFTGKEETLSSISPSGQNHQVVASYDAATKTADYSPYLPNSIYILASAQGSDDTYYDYQVGTPPQQISLSLEEFYKNYPIYYPSPDGKKTVWTEQRDGKNTLLVGDANGSNGKVAASLSDYSAFGWYSSQYLLITKDNSELAIIGLTGGTPQKITDYQANTYYATLP